MSIRAQLIKLTGNLIAIDSSRPAGKRKIIAAAKKFFPPKKVTISTIRKNGDYSLFIATRPEKKPQLILNGHLDVVSAPPALFRPKIKNGRLYGRGAGDMKSACAVMMLAFKNFLKISPTASLGLLLTSDEESGGQNGVAHLLKNGWGGHYAVVPDGGTELNTIITEKKGVLQIILRARGRSAHGARPFWGENAVDKLLKQYQKIRALVPELKTRRWRPTLSLGYIKGGQAINKVPDSAEMGLDIRFLKTTDLEGLIKKIKKIAPGSEIKNIGRPFYQNPASPFIKDYQKIAAQELGAKIKFGRMEGSSDARFFSALNIPTLVTRINSQNIHADNEYVEIAALEKFYNILIALMKKYARPDLTWP